MRYAGHLIVDVPGGEHRQHERTKLLDELAVAKGEFARRADREFDAAPHAARLRPLGVRLGARRNQGIEGQIRLCEFVRTSVAPRTDAGPGLRIRTGTGGDQQYLDLVSKAVAGVCGRKAHEPKSVLMFLPD